MRPRTSGLQLLALSFLAVAFSAGAALAQIGPPPPIGGTSMVPLSAGDSPTTTVPAGTFDLFSLFRNTPFSSWGSVSLIQPGTRSSAVALRERHGLMRLIP
jgi:hypothetical protein